MYRKTIDTKIKRNLLRVDNNEKYDRVRWPSRDEYRRRRLKEERIRISVRNQSYELFFDLTVMLCFTGNRFQRQCDG